MVTIVNVVDAIIVLGITLVWATNVTDVAIAWMIGDVGNTVLFAFFAVVALRQVGGRWDLLGGATVPAAADPVPKSLSATTQMRSLGMLVTLSEQQETADIYKPYHNSLTDSQGLFSIVALQAAERQRQRFIEESAAAAAQEQPQTPDESAAQHQQALELLFTLAERQREPGVPEPDEYPDLPGYAWPEQSADQHDQGK